jgi:hypothetical protein
VRQTTAENPTAILKRIISIAKNMIQQSSLRKEESMNVPASSSAADEKQTSARSGLEQLPVEIGGDTERTKSSLARLISNSADKLEGLMLEIQEMLDFLRAEGERVQGEITSYAQLNQKVALAATKIRAETVGSWKPAGEARQSPVRSLASGRDKIKRWPAPPD